MKKFTSMNKTDVVIEWSRKSLVGKLTGKETLEDLVKLISDALDRSSDEFTDDRGFYMLIHTDNNDRQTIYEPPLYIGLAFKQKLSVRPEQKSGHEKAYKCVIDNSADKSLFIKLGIVKDCNVGRETENLYEDIEECLICCNMPVCNYLLKKEYNSKRSLYIKNEGKPVPLKEKSCCYEGQVCSTKETCK